VIIVSAPLRGSDLATNWVGRLGSMLVKAPSRLLTAGEDALRFAATGNDELRLTRSNAVDVPGGDLHGDARIPSRIENWELRIERQARSRSTVPLRALDSPADPEW